MGGKCSIFRPDRLMRFSKKSQFAKLGSIKTFRSVNCRRNEAWPIQVNGGQMRDIQAGPLDALQHEKPVREVWIDQNVQVGELQEKRGMADPGDGDLAEAEFGKGRTLGLAGAPRQQGLRSE